jgi:hypothetical protein
MENTNLGLSVMFEEAKNQLSRQFKGSATLRDHAKTIIGVSSIVVSFFATFKIFDDAKINANIYLILLFLFIALTYGILMVLAIKTASPIALEAPINPTLEDYIEAYADKDERTILSNQINLYLKAIEINNKIIKKQRCLSVCVDYLLGIVVVLIITSTMYVVGFAK